MNKTTRAACCWLTMLCVWSPLLLYAMSGTTQVAWADRPVAAVFDWPAGALDLVNDPLRTDGWNPWFSELPNDVNWYEFKIQNSDDVNHLIEKLAAIKSTNVVLQLSPGRQAPSIGFTTVQSQTNRIAAVFSIGNQKQMNDWYQRLEETEPGVRKFGVSIYKQAPATVPPTLALYVKHPAIDLKQLKIPENVKMMAAIEQPEKGTEETIKAIEEFIAKQKPHSEHSSAGPPQNVLPAAGKGNN